MSLASRTRHVDRPQVLDLVDIAVLITYERTTTDPRFTGAKLQHVIFPGQTTAHGPVPLHRTGPDETLIAFTRAQQQQMHPRDPDSPSNTRSDAAPPPPPPPPPLPRDTPFNMLPLLPPTTPRLTPRQLETVFHRARAAADSCATALRILQRLLDRYAAPTPLRIRHVPAAASYTTAVGALRVVQQTITEPRHRTAVVVDGERCDDDGGGGERPTLAHAVAGFGAGAGAGAGEHQLASFLDLSSMRFGDAGRGAGGHALFVLDTLDQFCARLDGLGGGMVAGSMAVSRRVCGDDDDEGSWVAEVAARVAARLEARERERWCGHCGAPVRDDRRCGGCKGEWYCCREHQKMGWGFHKHYCVKRLG